jgi:hypothetical protein
MNTLRKAGKAYLEEIVDSKTGMTRATEMFMRMASIVMGPDDRAAIRAWEAIAKHVEGVKIEMDASVHQLHEWEVNADEPEVQNPIPPTPWANRLS